jgi:hypothetical protein
MFETKGTDPLISLRVCSVDLYAQWLYFQKIGDGADVSI